MNTCFTNLAAEAKENAEEGQRSVQPLGGDGLRVDATKLPDASTPRRGKNISTRSALLPPQNADDPSLRKTFINKSTIDAFSDIGKPVLLLFS